MGERVTGKLANQPVSHAVDGGKVQYLTYRQLRIEAELLARWAEEIRTFPGASEGGGARLRGTGAWGSSHERK